MHVHRHAWVARLVVTAAAVVVASLHMTVATTARLAVPVTAHVDTNASRHSVLPQYVSADMDWWHDTNGSGGNWGNASILWANLSDPLIQAAAAALSPGYLRIGGSEDVLVRYLVGGMSWEECTAGDPFRGYKNVSLCMTMERWDAINKFTHDAGLGVVFGVSYHKTLSGAWNDSNVVDLLRYSRAHGHDIAALELGEEMNPTGAALQQLYDGYAKLKEDVAAIWPADADAETDELASALALASPLEVAPHRPLILGPCVGMTYETPGNKMASWMEAFLPHALTDGLIDGVCMHSYNNDGGDGWRKPGFLNQTRAQATWMHDLTRNASATAPLFCGECGPHNGGGVPGKTDTALSSLWYTDALGGIAAAGFVEFGRQALVGSSYGLLQETTHIPNPDFFVAALWTKVMGTRVLSVTLSSSQDDIHVYAHCSSYGDGGGSVALAFVNIDPATAFAVNVASLVGGGARRDWVLTAPDNDLTSTTVQLNGKSLVVHAGDSSLPALDPVQVTGAAAATITVAPYSWGFAVFEGARAPACM